MCSSFTTVMNYFEGNNYIQLNDHILSTVSLKCVNPYNKNFDYIWKYFYQKQSGDKGLLK